MKRIVTALLISLTILPVSKTHAEQTKARVFVTDSTSWEIAGGWGMSHGSGGGSTKGGARPQTGEIIKTFGERCPDIVVNNRKELADYVVLLDHEGGKGLAQKKNKIAVFGRSGDSIFSASTRSLGNSVKDACDAIVTDFQHNPPSAGMATEQSLAATPTADPAPQVAAVTPGQPGGPAADAPASVSVKSTPDGADITVDGKFAGSTPSTLKLLPGDHTISVEVAGFSGWQKAMTLNAGSDITLSVTLEKAQQ